MSLTDSWKAIAALASENPRSTSYMRHRAGVTARPTEAGPSAWITLDDVSPFLVACVIATEDPLFLRHRGFWWRQIARATWSAWRERRRVRAVSTITQQLARNLFLTPERSFGRKLREATLTLAMEHYLPKARILALYVNLVEWGDDIWGVHDAAARYCGSAASDLTPFHAAVLASLLPAPRARLHGANLDRARAAQQSALFFLYAAGLVSVDQLLHGLRCAVLLQRHLVLGQPLEVALRILRGLNEPCVVRPGRAFTSAALLTDGCGFAGRVAFERELARNPAHLREIGIWPTWWTLPVKLASSAVFAAGSKPSAATGQAQR